MNVKLLPRKEKKERERDLFAEEVPDLDGLGGVSDGGVDRKVGVDTAHLVAIPLCHTRFLAFSCLWLWNLRPKSSPKFKYFYLFFNRNFFICYCYYLR